MPAASKKPIPDGLKNFELLPDSANVRLPTVCALFACAPATVWRRAKYGALPKPYKHSAKVTVWNVGELRKTLRALHGDTAGIAA
jgi:predicted DNA-binding transcriptional regulator AlpA